MLDGELAVPCNLQSALAGSNSEYEAMLSDLFVTDEGVDGLSLVKFGLPNPVRTGR